MPTAGQRVLAADFTQSVVSTDSTTQWNVGTTAAVGSPEVAVTFTAPTSGKVLVNIASEMQDNVSDNAVYLDWRLYEDDGNGAIILNLGSSERYMKTIGHTSSIRSQAVGRSILVPGLTAGQVYFLRLYHSATGGTSADVLMRQVSVVPLPA